MQDRKNLKIITKELEKILNKRPDQQKVNKLATYLDLLIKWNEKINLTGYKKWDEIFYKLILDSFHLLILLNGISLPEDFVVIDFGAGGGIPGIPLRIFWDRGHYIMVESKQKKCVFLKEIIRILDLHSIKVENSRIEKLHNKSLKADVVLARAFKDAISLLRLADPFLVEDGYVVYFSNHPYIHILQRIKGFMFVMEKKYHVSNLNKYLWLFRKYLY